MERLVRMLGRVARIKCRNQDLEGSLTAEIMRALWVVHSVRWFSYRFIHLWISAGRISGNPFLLKFSLNHFLQAFMLAGLRA